MELFLFLPPAKFWGLWGRSLMALFFITYVMIINCLESSSSAIRTKTWLLLPSDSLILSPAGWTEKQDLCFSFVWLCFCLCCRSSEGRGHPGPHYISWQRPIRTGLHLQAAVPSGAAAVRGLGVQGRHLLLGRTELHDCRQDLWQQDPRVRLRDCNGGLFLSLPFPADFNKDSSISSDRRAAMLDCETESSGNYRQSLLEGPSAQSQPNEGLLTLSVSPLRSVMLVWHMQQWQWRGKKSNQLV